MKVIMLLIEKKSEQKRVGETEDRVRKIPEHDLELTQS